MTILAKKKYDIIRPAGIKTVGGIMFQKSLFKQAVMISMPFLLSAVISIPSFADTAKRDGMGNSAANLSAATTYAGEKSGWLTYDSQSVYFSNNGRIYQTSLSGGEVTELLDTGNTDRFNTLRGLNVYQGFLYFIDGYSISRLNLSNGSSSVLSRPGGYCETLLLLDETLYIVDSAAHNLLRMNLDGSGKETVARLDESLWEDGKMLESWRCNQYAFSDGFLYYTEKDTSTLDAVSLVRMPLSGGTESVVVPAYSDPPGGGFSPAPDGTTVTMPFAPVVDGDWIYYLEYHEPRIILENGQLYSHYDPITGIWRVHPDGSGKELVYENVFSPIGDEVLGRPTSERAILAYTVRDGQVFLSREGSLGFDTSTFENTTPDIIYKVENGELAALYSGPVPTRQSDSHIQHIATVPGWIYFTQNDEAWIEVPGEEEGVTYSETTTDTTRVYRMRFDGSELECLTP